MQTTTSGNHTVITADTGKVLMDGDYCFFHSILLGANDSIDNYTEITEEEATEIQSVMDSGDEVAISLYKLLHGGDNPYGESNN